MTVASVPKPAPDDARVTDAGLVPHITLPCERFYWGVLDTSSLSARQRRDPQSLGYLFENFVPVPIEQLQATYQPIANNRVIACGLPREELRGIADGEPTAFTLVPSNPPESLASDEIDLERLNMLTGDFEPAPLRRGRRRLAVHAAVGGVITVSALLLGLERRIALEHTQTGVLRDARLQVIQQVIGPPTSVGAGANAQPPELRFLAELRTLRQTRQQQNPTDPGSSGHSSPTNELLTLVALAVRWPAELHITTESLSITATSVTLHAAATSSGEVQSLADALGNLDAANFKMWGSGPWRSQQPQVSTVSAEKVDATLQWQREGNSPEGRTTP